MTSEKGRFSCMKVLVDSGADVNQKAESRHTILTLATKNGHYECVNILVNTVLDVNIVNGFNETALMYASDNLTCSKLLLKSGAKINIFNTRNRKTLSCALWALLFTQRKENFRAHSSILLFAAGETVDPRILRQLSKQSSTAESSALNFLLNKDLKLYLKHLCREAMRRRLTMTMMTTPI